MAEVIAGEDANGKPRELLTDIDGTLHVAAVDQGIAFIAAGNVDCTGAAKLTALTGAGYLIVTNLDPSATVYLGISTVTGSTNGEALLPGDTRSWRSGNLALEYGIGSATVNVSVRR